MDSLVEIFDSIKNNDILRLNNILNANQNLINKYLYGVTPFLYAIECGNENIALELCKRGDINFSLKDNLDFNCLEKSIESKMHNLSEIIFTKNKALNLDEILIDKETILTRSLKNEDSNVCKVLINGMVYFCFILACKILIYSINFFVCLGRVNVNKPNDMGEYPLQIAIRLNKIDAVKEMLKKNDVYINSFDNGYNPLLDACEKDLTEIGKKTNLPSKLGFINNF
jgi:ankyrin repeat protein